MPNIILIGLNHETAPIELRECIAFSPDDTQRALTRLSAHADIAELMILSTCNRVEFLAVANNSELAVTRLKSVLAAVDDIRLPDLQDALYVYENEKAVRHVFRVAASLDSMIVGEPQILGQLKEAYQTACRAKTTGVILNRLMHRSFSVAKRVRTETGIGDHAVSISYAAVELGRKIFDTLRHKKVLLIGAGEMAEIAVEHLIRQHVGAVFVTNRTFERAAVLAKRFSGRAVGFAELGDRLKDVDIIISSTASPDLVVTRSQVKGMMRVRRNRPLFFIDIAVPRDIDPAINRLPNFFVYDIDDLKGVISDNIEDRKKEALKGERIVDEALIRFREWLENLHVTPTIVDLRRKIETIAAEELQKTVQALPPMDHQKQQALQKMTTAIINKILHDPIMLLKSHGTHINKSVYLDFTRKLFKLDEG